MICDRTRRFALVALCGLAPVAVADDDAALPRILLDAELRPRTIRLVSISADSVVVRAPEGGPAQTLRRAAVVAILPVPADSAAAAAPAVIDTDAPPPGWLELTDGQVLPGMLASEPAGAESVAWESRLWGRVAFPLDAVARVILRPQDVTRDPPGTSDRLILVNGDRAEGFVGAVGAMFQIERDGKRTDLPAARVVGAWLANPPAPATGDWVWITDGTAAAVSSVLVSPAGEVTLRGPGAASATRLPGELRAVLFNAGAIRALATLRPESAGPQSTSGRR